MGARKGAFVMISAVMVLTLWIKRFRIRASVVNAVTFSLFFVAYFFTIIPHTQRLT